MVLDISFCKTTLSIILRRIYTGKIKCDKTVSNTELKNMNCLIRIRLLVAAITTYRSEQVFGCRVIGAV